MIVIITQELMVTTAKRTGNATFLHYHRDASKQYREKARKRRRRNKMRYILKIWQQKFFTT